MKSLTTLSLVALFALLTAAPAQADDHNNYWRQNGNGYGQRSFDHGNRFYDYGTNGFRNNVYRNNDFVNTNNGNGRGYGFGNSNSGNGFGNSNRRYGNIDNTQAQLQSRINAGISSGRLSSREQVRLQAKLSQIASVEARLRASGQMLNSREHMRLSNMLSKLNTDITRELNDFERRQIGFRNGSNWR